VIIVLAVGFGVSCLFLFVSSFHLVLGIQDHEFPFSVENSGSCIKFSGHYLYPCPPAKNLKWEIQILLLFKHGVLGTFFGKISPYWIYH